MRKINKLILLVIILFFFSTITTNAQKVYKQNPGFIFGFSYGYNVSGGDLSTRFGNNFKIDVSPTFYFSGSNISVGIEASYIFSGKVKEHSFLNILTFDRHVINNNGTFATIQTSERGVLFGGLISKIIPFNRNIRTGIKIEAGGYLFRHWISFKTIGEIRQLTSDYLKGYDRLTGGLALKEFVGYQYLSEKSKINFYAGFEFYQGFTKSIRGYDYDKASVDNFARKDLLYGIKIGWILPLYIVKNPEEIYY